jgi:hypothetical protein
MIAELEVLLGNAFLSTATINFQGPFSGVFRDQLT